MYLLVARNSLFAPSVASAAGSVCAIGISAHQTMSGRFLSVASSLCASSPEATAGRRLNGMRCIVDDSTRRTRLDGSVAARRFSSATTAGEGVFSAPPTAGAGRCCVQTRVPVTSGVRRASMGQWSARCLMPHTRRCSLGDLSSGSRNASSVPPIV